MIGFLENETVADEQFDPFASVVEADPQSIDDCRLEQRARKDRTAREHLGEPTHQGVAKGEQLLNARRVAVQPGNRGRSAGFQVRNLLDGEETNLLRQRDPCRSSRRCEPRRGCG